MPAHAHAVETHAPNHPAQRLERTRSSRYLVPALRGGPTLRKLLGPSAWELWGRLQTRAYRSPERMITTTLRELAGARGSERTVGWCLRRLVEAHVIAKVKTRTGVAIRVLAFDRDEWGNGEYSPHLMHSTLCWMHGRRPRGRPKLARTPMPQARTPEPPKRLSLPPAAPPRAPLHSEALAIVRAMPFMPPDPLRHIEGIPRLPKPPLLDPEARPSEHREHLIELYVSASRVYWPRATCGREVKHLRSRYGSKLLTQAAETLIEHRLPPAMWVKYEFDRVVKQRMTPMRPEILFDPNRIKNHFEQAAADTLVLLTGLPDRSEEFRSWREARLALNGLHNNLIHQISQLPNLCDENAVRVVVEAAYPGGWEQTYLSASAKMREITSTLEQRALNGKYLWGLPRG